MFTHGHGNAISPCVAVVARLCLFEEQSRQRGTVAEGRRGGSAGCYVERLVSDASAWLFCGLFVVQVDSGLTELQGLADLRVAMAQPSYHLSHFGGL